MAEVKLVNVSKTFEKGNVAVKNVNLEIKDKEFVVLVGPSGCGKSTTLRMIAGLEEITAGELYIDGELMNYITPKNRDIAMVFQNYALYPHMTVYENMAFGLKLRKYKKNEIDERVNEAASILNLEDLLDRRPKALSGGQRQRVAVGRAIVRKPKVFLFDEPLSNLDAKLRVQMRTEISKLHQKLSATIVYVTHDQTEAMTMGSRIVIMNKGVVHQVATPLELYNKPVNKFVAGFIGSPAMNFVEGTISSNNSKLLFTSASNDLLLQIDESKYPKLKSYANKIIIGVRPEDIFPSNDNGAGSYAAELEVVEPMGNELFLYFTLSGIQMVARVSKEFVFAAGDKINLSFNPDKLYFFDKDMEQSIN
ncbi:MAG: sn-glycerol-3-phosphate ABC transporter ATP-binding protein UgpC [Ignavibacteriaceae bacterium]|jgi:multiple sugar transport system ATP-binding protein